MKTNKEFIDIDFAQPTLINSLARAYAVILNTEHPTVHAAPVCNSQKQRKPKRAVAKKQALVQRFRKLFLAGMPETHSKMQRPGAKAKYYKRFHSLTDYELVSHLEGHATFAAPLIGRDGFTREVALDIDAGGEEAIKEALHIAVIQGLTAYGLVSRGAGNSHDGGHIRIPLADTAAPERARLLAEQLRAALVQQTGLAENKIEVYPTQRGLRLPFGVHTHTGKRGALLMQDGTNLNLDSGEPLATITQALTLLEGLTLNSLECLPPLPQKIVVNAPVTSSDASQRLKTGNPIQDYNQTTNLLDWLLSLGAQVASTTRQNGYLLHCPCGNHKHQDARPSLEIQKARNPRYGEYVIIGYASGCLFETHSGRIIDAFEAYCRWYSVNTKTALAQLYPRQMMKK